MANHYSTIGFRVETKDQFFALGPKLAENAETINVLDGRYLRWSSESGAEMWMQQSRDGYFIGMVPHFSGQSRVRTRVTKRITRPGRTALDGAFYGWSDPVNLDPAVQRHPFVFDCPDYAVNYRRNLPTVVDVQLAAFAHTIDLFDTPEAFESGGMAIASRSFIPSGILTPNGETIDPPESRAIFSGHIVRSATKRNDHSGNEFYWALVESLGATFDVVIDPGMIDRRPKVGGVLAGSFWLSGRITN